MVLWEIKPDWQGQDAYIIGGGPSLQKFDFNLLRGRNTLGCNHAFRLGGEAVKYCLFGDASFFDKTRDSMMGYTGQWITCAPAVLSYVIPYCHKLERVRDGLHSGTKIGWNYSTGASAINVALNLGATRIFLLGFDLTHQTKTHWHKHAYKVTKHEAYTRFLRGFANVAQSLRRFPAVQVINVTDGTSKLTLFQDVMLPEFVSFLQNGTVPVTMPAKTPLEVQVGQPEGVAI